MTPLLSPGNTETIGHCPKLKYMHVEVFFLGAGFDTSVICGVQSPVLGGGVRSVVY